MRKNIHTNIMLDLECTGILPNPCILQIGAVHFDLDTGEEYSHFCTPISLKSCEDVNLQSTEDTMEWLLKHSPQVLEESRRSEISIFQALFRFNIFLSNAVRSNRHRLEETGRLYASDMSELMVWGNGAVADNTWINSAYAACGMADRQPWTYKNDMCVRTLVRTAGDILGRDFAKEESFQGTRHDALDNCRHQIRYMVKARNAMKTLSVKPKPVPSLLMTLPIWEKGGEELEDTHHDEASKDAGRPESAVSPNISLRSPSSTLENTISKISRQPVSTIDKIIYQDGFPNFKEVTSTPSFQLSSSLETFQDPQQSLSIAGQGKDDAYLDALVQAAYEAYEQERTPRGSQAELMILATPDRTSLGIHGGVLDEHVCEQQPREVPAMKLAEQLDKLEIS